MFCGPSSNDFSIHFPGEEKKRRLPSYMESHYSLSTASLDMTALAGGLLFARSVDIFIYFLFFFPGSRWALKIKHITGPTYIYGRFVLYGNIIYLYPTGLRFSYILIVGNWSRHVRPAIKSTLSSLSKQRIYV